MLPEEPAFRTLPRDERRERILRAAKLVVLDKGLDQTSMDDVAAAAGTTKPTVYAHFKSKEELFAAVAEYIRGHFVGKLRSPDAYGDEPVEAVTRFCGRFVELVCWEGAVGYQRVTLAGATQSPGVARAVYDTLYGEACRSLAGYLRARKLVARHAEQHAESLLYAAAGAAVLRHLFGVDAPCPDVPDPAGLPAGVDLKRIRETVKLIASAWDT